MRTHRLTALTLLVAIIAGCGADDPLAAPTDVTGAWVLTSGRHAGSAIEPIDTHPVTIEFDEDGLGGTAACNGYGGTYTLDGSALALSALSITEMACSPEEAMALEADYMAALVTVTEARNEGARLILSGPETTLEFEALPPVPTSDLQGTVWVLDGLITGDAVSSVGGGRATLELFTDGSLLGSTGCRSLTGTYVESAGSIETASLSAEGECSDDLASQDGHVISVLEGGFTVEIEENRLTISTSGGDGLTYLAGS